MLDKRSSVIAMSSP